MPEGPEIQRQTDWIRQLIGTKVFVGIKKIDNCKYSFDTDRFKEAFNKPLRTITCKGKWFFLGFDIGGEGLWIAAHHGMGGHWTNKRRSGDNNYHIKMYFADVIERDGKDVAENIVKLYLNNARFGDFKILTTSQAAKKIGSIANGFIGDYQLTEKEWLKNLSKFTNRKVLYSLWLEQDKLCSGIGNYLRAEIMYEAGLHPAIILGDLNEDERKELFLIAKNTVERFYSKEKVFKVYQQNEDPEGNKVSKKKKSGRTVWYVKAKQPAPLWLKKKQKEAKREGKIYSW